MSLPSNLNDETNCHARVLVRAAETINDEEALIGKLFLCDILNSSPSLFRGLVVIVMVCVAIPPNRVMGRLIIDDEFVLRGTAREDTGLNINGTQLRDLTLLVARQTILRLLLEENLVRRIVEDFRYASDSVLAKIDICHLLSTSFIENQLVPSRESAFLWFSPHTGIILTYRVINVKDFTSSLDSLI